MLLFPAAPHWPSSLVRLSLTLLLALCFPDMVRAQSTVAVPAPTAAAAPAAAAPAAAAPAAPDPLPRLLAERERLMDQYREAEQQRNSLFGNNPSKKDLEEVVATLRGIVAKDDEIVPAVKTSARAAAERLAAANAQLAYVNQQLTAANAGLQNINLGDRSAASDRLHELNEQVLNLEQRARQQAARQRDQQADVQEAQSARRIRDLIITALVVACGVLGWLLYRRR